MRPDMRPLTGTCLKNTGSKTQPALAGRPPPSARTARTDPYWRPDTPHWFIYRLDARVNCQPMRLMPWRSTGTGWPGCHRVLHKPQGMINRTSLRVLPCYDSTQNREPRPWHLEPDCPIFPALSRPCNLELAISIPEAYQCPITSDLAGPPAQLEG